MVTGSASQPASHPSNRPDHAASHISPVLPSFSTPLCSFSYQYEFSNLLFHLSTTQHFLDAMKPAMFSSGYIVITVPILWLFLSCNHQTFHVKSQYLNTSAVPTTDSEGPYYPSVSHYQFSRHYPTGCFRGHSTQHRFKPCLYSHVQKKRPQSCCLPVTCHLQPNILWRRHKDGELETPRSCLCALHIYPVRFTSVVSFSAQTNTSHGLTSSFSSFWSPFFWAHTFHHSLSPQHQCWGSPPAWEKNPNPNPSLPGHKAQHKHPNCSHNIDQSFFFNT